MGKETPGRSRAARQGSSDSVAGAADDIPLATEKQPRPAPALDLHVFRKRLFAARFRLILHIHEDWSDDQTFPAPALCGLLADIEICILATDGVLGKGVP